jgi:VWFA-related protein
MANRSYVARIGEIACAVFACLVAVKAHGQSQPPPPAPPNQNTSTAGTLRVTTRAVQVSVIAQDGDGHPIAGLTRDDFTILDNGVPQKIVSFTQQSSHVTASVSASTAAIPTHAFSNRIDQKTDVPPSVTVVLLDALDSDQYDMISAREQVVKFIDQMQPDDRVALYALTPGGKIIVLHDFTSDTATLLRALGRTPKVEKSQNVAQEGNVAPVSVVGAHQLAGAQAGDPQALERALEREGDFDQVNRIETISETFKAIARHLARLPGRKNLVWISGSFPFNFPWVPGSFRDASNFEPSIIAAAHALSDADVAIYPVDARGLMAQRPDEPGRLFARHYPSAPPQLTLATMQSLAQGTGGIAFYNTNDIGGAIRRAIDDSSLTYELAYYPSHDQWDGRFRGIKVEVKHSGARLRYRKGYFATPATQSTPKSQGQILTVAARNPLEATELGLNVQINAADAPGARRAKVEVRVDCDQLHFELHAGHWTDKVEVAWIELDADGEDIGHSARTIDLNIPDQTHDKISRDGLVFNETIGLVDECVELRLVARDAGTGSIGSVNIPLTRIFLKASAAAPPRN